MNITIDINGKAVTIPYDVYELFKEYKEDLKSVDLNAVVKRLRSLK